MAFALPAASLLIVTTIVMHYEALRIVSHVVVRISLPLRLRVLFVVLGCFVAHVAEIGVYALAYAAGAHFGWGGLGGELTGDWVDYFYFSATSYSTLGYGDVYPTGSLRLMSGLEAVNGLFLIAWSTSFTYLAMERMWPLHTRIGGEDD